MGTKLLEFYNKLNDVHNCQKIYNKLPQNVENTQLMMNLYYANKMYNEVIEMFQKSEETMKDYKMYVLVLNSCAELKDEINGNIICQEIKSKKLDKNSDIHGSLIYYNGSIYDSKKAQILFDSNRNKDTHGLNGLMKVYLNSEQYREVIKLFFDDKYNFDRNDESYVTVLNACGMLKNTKYGGKVLEEIRDYGINSDEVNYALMFYHGCLDNIEMGEDIFNSMDDKDIHAYNAMFMAYFKSVNYDKLWQLYWDDNVVNMLNKESFEIGLNACALLNDIKTGVKILEIIDKSGINMDESIIQYYCNIHETSKAEDVFNRLNEIKLSTYLAMMKGYVSGLDNDKAIELWENKDISRYKTKELFVCMVNACGMAKKEAKLDDILTEIIEYGYNNDDEINIALINGYRIAGNMNKSEDVYDKIDNKSAVIFVAMMKNYIDNKQYGKALDIFFDTKTIKIIETYTMALNACLISKDAKTGDKIYEEIKSKNIDDKDVYASLINYYGSTNNIAKAEEVYNNIKSKDIYLRSIMVNMFRVNNENNKAIELFMNTEKDSNININSIISSMAINVCIELNSIETATNILHKLQQNYDSIYNSILVQASLINMNFKLNSTHKGLSLFNQTMLHTFNNHDKLVLYCVIMLCFEKQGKIPKCSRIFDELKNKGIFITDKINNIIKQPNSHIISPLLNGVNLKSNLNKAEAIYLEYSNKISLYYKDKIKMLMSILSSCRVFSDEIRAERIVKMIEELYHENNDKNIDGNVYVLLSNIYGQNRKYDKANQVRAKIKKSQSK